jgi:lipoprotein-releasing system permease protein
MGFAFTLALRYLRSKKRGFISLSTLFAVLGVALGTAALVAVMSVTGGFRAQFQKKVLGVNAHVIVMRASFRDYREVVARVGQLPEVIGIAPFTLNAMMITHHGHTATGVQLKGVDPDRVGSVLDLPEQMVAGTLDGLRLPGRPPALALDATDPFGIEPRAFLPGAPSAAQVEAVPRHPAAELPPGSIVPAGGYTSQLPDADTLPEELAGDPCTEAEGQALPGIVIGFGLRDTLHAALGDCVQVTSPLIGFAFVGGQIRPAVAKVFKVTGVFRAGFEQYDARFAYADLRETQDFYQEGDAVTGVEIKVADVDRANEVAARVDETLGGRPYDVMDWMQLNHGLFTALRIQQILMSLVLALIVLVAAFTVIATLIMVVLDKKKEIAVMKAMGASDAQLLRAFLYQGLAIGLFGAAFGLGGGYVLCRWILAHGFPLDPKVYFIDHLPVRIRGSEFALTGAFAILACLGATVWPAVHAARLRPTEAFRES